MEFDRDHNLERYLDYKNSRSTCRAVWKSNFTARSSRLRTPSTRRLLDNVAMRVISTRVAALRYTLSMTAAAFLTWPPGYRGVNDQFFVAQGDTFGRVARLYEYIPSLYADASVTFHPEHLLGYAAVAALRLELRYYEAPPPDPVAIPEPVPGFASASGREEAPCDYAAAGYHIRRHSEREGAWL